MEKDKVEVVDEKFYDLSFLTQYYDNEQEFINSILALYVKETPSSIHQIEDAVNKKTGLHLNLCHIKLKPTL